uniref:uncharacterized protein LOC122585449 n=1 Tax=Erigeron canadensis TaxID=72917 RepID=UPI001CB9BC83|nr:uncharacterized protein LOC122585449 [Erigeron canadensis]
MADYEAETSSANNSMKINNKKKKRKLSDSDQKHNQKSSKSSRIDEPIEEDNKKLIQDVSPWRNLQLILSLKDNNLHIEKKVDLAYKFVKLRYSQVEDDTTKAPEAVSLERLIVFLNSWVQSALISSEKKVRVEGVKFGLSGSCLDYRCWTIFKFCLQEGTALNVSLSFAKDILKVIQCVARNMVIKDLNDDESVLYYTMLDCISSIFASHGGVSNENLDLWILLVGTVLELGLNVITSKLDDNKLGMIVLNLTCFVLDPFTKFLRLHPNKKNGFQDLVDRLLEPLLCLLHVLHQSVITGNSPWMSKLLKLVEEVLCQGLFHPSHIDGFLSLQGLTKYTVSDDGKAKDMKIVIKSYHRHLFVKLGRIVVAKNALALFGAGELFRLYVHCIKRQEGIKVTDDSSKVDIYPSGSHSGVSEKSQVVSSLSPEVRKSLFDVLVQIMEPFLGDIDTYLQNEVELGSVLEDVYCTVKSIKSILKIVMQEKIYLRVDDTSEGACANFLKVICNKITLLSAKIGQIVPSTFYANNKTCKESVEVLGTELVLCIRYLLEIDYEVLGNDLESLWLLMFSFGTLGHTLNNVQNKTSVIPEILHLGCHMVNLYSELRQVGTSIFALCKAVRHFVSSVGDVEANHSDSWRSSLYHESWTKSLRLILCSSELRLSIHNAVKSIPEGQVSLCIRELASDLSESLKWMNGNVENSSQNEFSTCLKLKAEILGIGLSEVYSLILDSLMVSTGNSSLVGDSLNAFMTVIRPSMSLLISQPSDGVYEFLATVSGKKFSNQAERKEETLHVHWIFVFCFRLYMSSRSLYRQAASLAPPTTSKRMSEEMRDSFTACSGNDWLEKTEKDEGYFSWIVQPSASLLLIIEAILDIFPKESVADLSPLTYVLNVMTIQRLVDLNRLINSFEFVIKRNDMVISDEDSSSSKQNNRLRKRLSKLSKEATGLANYLMGHLSLLKKWQPNNKSTEDGWDIAVAAIDKSSLPCAFWSIVCQNTDIWSMHAAKKKLKMFLSVLLQNSLPYAANTFNNFGEHNSSMKAGNLKTVNGRDISLELLSNTMFYEEKFVRKHMASRICQFLEDLVSPLFSNGVIELQAQPNWAEVISSLKFPSDLPIRKGCIEQEVDSSSVRIIYTACENSLSFLSWMPKRCISSKSFSLYATCILNLERLIVGTLVGDNDTPLFHDHYDLLRLLFCCRKTLKHLMATFCEENLEAGENSLGALHFGGKFPALWIIKSLLSVQHAFSMDGDTQVSGLIISLTDYTAYVFLTLIKGTFIHASHSLISSRKPFQLKTGFAFDHEDSDHSESLDASNFLIHVAEALKDHSQVMLTPQSDKNSKSHLQKLSSNIACVHGFLWGISSTLCHMDAQSINLKAIFLRRNFEPVDKLKLCIDTYTTVVNQLLCELVLLDDKLLKTADKNFNLEDVDMDILDINRGFLHGLVAGENLEAAFLLRQLFIAFSVILKLHLQTKMSLSSNLMKIFIAISEIVLLEFSNNTRTPSHLTSVFLDGIGKFLEEAANHPSVTNSPLPTDLYERLIDLHLKAIGKCISLQGKEATLESHETESSTKMMNGPLVFSECAYSSLDELKMRLRNSLKVLVRKPSDKYISSAMKSIKIGLVGLQGGNMASYQIYAGSSCGGIVSSVVAASIDCLDLVLEAITGRKGMSMVKMDILGSVCCLFNIILHLQGPTIFYKDFSSNMPNCLGPDPGSVVLMCIEVLTKVSGKHALYQMDACSVAQALSIPATLFQNILQLRTFEASTQSAFRRSSGVEDKYESKNYKLLDGHYTIELYAACCRMLHTFLRHHKRESLQHIALVQASVSVLLHCLEMANKEQAVQKNSFVWQLEEGVKCGTFLRRIYEEIRQQKDVIGKDCRLFLSTYILVYSGYGPLKVGIRREIDEALRPGVYALIDACSPDDLQYLHTVLGEGPCRNTLANLQHDYKLNFQYEGKV